MRVYINGVESSNGASSGFSGVPTVMYVGCYDTATKFNGLIDDLVILDRTAPALALIAAAGRPNLRLQYDIYHAQIIAGDLARTLEANIQRIGHIQIASIPSRNEPDDEELNYPFLFGELDRLVDAMVAHDYPLQALLYEVALHRYLRWRLPAYDPEAHLGGAAYLFLRGMAGPDTPVTPNERTYGVFTWQPPTGLILALSNLLAGAELDEVTP